jgi:hypothetical protein
MIDDLLRKIEEAIKGFFADSLIGSLEKLTVDINATVTNIGSEVVKGPQDWNSEIFTLIKTLSDNVILPLAGILITYVLVYELYHMVVDNNNMKAFEPTDMVKYLIKAFLAVFILSHTFEIAMAIFDVAGHVVQSAIAVINGSTAISLGDYSSMRSTLMSMELYEVVAMWAEAQVIGTMVWVISIVIMVILYGRMLEVYIYISVAPLPFAAFGNRELSGMSQNYVKGLVAVAFQGFFIMVVVGIYAKLIATIGSGGDLHKTLFNVAISTLVLLFVLLKTGTISKSIFGAH